MRKKSVWKFKKEKKKYIGNYEYLRARKGVKPRVFVLTPINGLGNLDVFESWEDAKKVGWRKIQ